MSLVATFTPTVEHYAALEGIQQWTIAGRRLGLDHDRMVNTPDRMHSCILFGLMESMRAGHRIVFDFRFNSPLDPNGVPVVRSSIYERAVEQLVEFRLVRPTDRTRSENLELTDEGEEVLVGARQRISRLEDMQRSETPLSPELQAFSPYARRVPDSEIARTLKPLRRQFVRCKSPRIAEAINPVGRPNARGKRLFALL